MELTDIEKKILTALHGAKLVNWKFLPAFEEFLKEYVNFEEIDLKSMVDKFVNLGLLDIVHEKDGEVICMLTDVVGSNLLDEELVYYGHSYIEGHD
ncbi:MAG: hypothetical protein Q8P57_02335 [Candidatus Pacearchaeota archaeon]|nr:hypothetical protein [Candidatus Pacearchaeota archaeon]